MKQGFLKVTLAPISRIYREEDLVPGEKIFQLELSTTNDMSTFHYEESWVLLFLRVLTQGLGNLPAMLWRVFPFGLRLDKMILEERSSLRFCSYHYSHGTSDSCNISNLKRKVGDSFIHQIFIKPLVCTRHCWRPWSYSEEQDSQGHLGDACCRVGRQTVNWQDNFVLG